MSCRRLTRSLLFLASVLIPLVTALETNGNRGGTFDNPPATSRPFFRYWLPDASVDPELVAQDIASAGEIGAGGFELVPFYNYGGEMGKYPAGADWAKYGFGTPAFRGLFRRALQAHRDNGMLMDFAIGPNQGQGVPAEPGDEGLQWDLSYFAQPIPSNAGERGFMLPGWGSGEMVATVTAVATHKINITTGSPHLQLVLRDGSLKAITPMVDHHGVLDSTDEAFSGPSEHWVFAFYQRKTLAKNLDFDTQTHETIFDNGSFTVDHFSIQGAQTVIKFWEKHILRDGVDKLLSEAGHYGWEDSLELKSNISWTPKLPAQFRSQHGYDLFPYLPLIAWGNNNVNTQRDQPGNIRVLLDSDDSGTRHINAYRATLQRCYQEYLRTLSKWTNNRLGLPMSAQVSYNMPMDAAAGVPFVDVPECESLQWEDNIDGYRQFAGAAELAGQQIVSNEMGAKFLSAFKHQIVDLLRSVNRAFAGGINRVVLHGHTYAHKYYETTWPGYTAWQYVVSEAYSNKMPSWNHGLDEALNYIARTQHVLQSGHARVDIALYNKVSVSDFNFRTFRDPTDLLSAGYSYAYITPDNLEVSAAKVRQGRLGPDTASFKALAITSQHNEVTLDGAKNLVRLAKRGLPIIVEAEPKFYAMGNQGTGGVSALLETLFTLPSVHRCAEGDLVSSLQRIGISPQVTTRLDATAHTVWRDDDRNGMSYLFVFAENYTSGSLEVPGGQVPYVFDAWTGQVKALIHYSLSKEGHTMLIPISLEAGQTIIFGFAKRQLKGTEVPRLSIKSVPSTVLGYEFSKRAGLTLQVSKNASLDATQEVVFSNGKRQRIQNPYKTRPQFEFQDWTLVVEHWEAPRDLAEASVVAVKRNTTHELKAPLNGWTQHPELANVSGIGYYQTTFKWLDDTVKHGAYLHLPPILHAMQVVVNGQKTPPIDSSHALIDIGPFLRVGKNAITIIVPSTMWNYIRSFGNQILSSGAPPLHVYGVHGELTTLPPPGPSENGLIGRVKVVPYERIRVSGFS